MFGRNYSMKITIKLVHMKSSFSQCEQLKTVIKIRIKQQTGIRTVYAYSRIETETGTIFVCIYGHRPNTKWSALNQKLNMREFKQFRAVSQICLFFCFVSFLLLLSICCCCCFICLSIKWLARDQHPTQIIHES